MTSELLANRLDPLQIHDYLLEHPDFFERYPELLLSLKLPHSQLGAVSLFERQHKLLRDRVERSEAQINHLLSVASRNEALYHLYSELTFHLLDCQTLTELESTLVAQLREKFNFTRASLTVAITPGQFRNPEHLSLLKSRLDSKGYYFGRLSSQEASQVVKQETGSVALIGLGAYGKWEGFVSVASHDPGHFMAQMDTMLLDQLQRLLLHRIRILTR